MDLNSNSQEGFTELHNRVYKDVLEGRGYGLEPARAAIKIVKICANMTPGEGCPMKDMVEVDGYLKHPTAIVDLGAQNRRFEGLAFCAHMFGRKDW